jgi:16S rRNA processing protein RimM
MAEPSPQPSSGNRPRRQPRQTYTHRNRTVTVPAGYIVVGYVAGVHGLRGELRVELYTDFPERFVPGAILCLGEELNEVTVAGARLHKQLLLLRLEEVQSREQAEALRNQWLFVDEEDAVELVEGAYWIHDIIGLTVQTSDDQELGVVKEVLFTGANDVYVVETLPTVNHGRDLLLPATEEVIQTVDLVAGRMIVQLLPGLIDE